MLLYGFREKLKLLSTADERICVPLKSVSIVATKVNSRLVTVSWSGKFVRYYLAFIAF